MKTIKGKFVTIFTSTLFVTIILQILFTTFFAENVYINGRKKEILQSYNQLTTNYSSNPINIYSKVYQAEDEFNLRVLVFDKNGRIVYQTLSGSVSTSYLANYNIGINSKLTENFMKYPQVQLLSSYRNDSQSLVIRGSVETDNTTHYILLESPLATITDATQTLVKMTFSIHIAGMIFGAFIIYLFSSKLSKPLSAISKVAQNVTNLNFSTKVETTKNNDEINNLATNINQMSSTIENMIVELTSANAELQRDNDLRVKVDNMRKEFVSNVSHELKTPLALMQGYAEMLKSDIDGIDKDYYYDVIMQESKHMNELVNRLLNTSSLENGLTKLNFEYFNLTDLTKYIIEKNKTLAPSLNVNFTGENELNLVADKLYIEQVMTNLLTNAFRYASNEIDIVLYNLGDKIRFNIHNDGEKISEDFIDDIWFSFYREDKSRTRSDAKNFGLGLYIAKTIITAHGGEVGVNNTDNGVCFWFELDKKLDI